MKTRWCYANDALLYDTTRRNERCGDERRGGEVRGMGTGVDRTHDDSDSDRYEQ